VWWGFGIVEPHDFDRTGVLWLASSPESWLSNEAQTLAASRPAMCTVLFRRLALQGCRLRKIMPGNQAATANLV